PLDVLIDIDPVLQDLEPSSRVAEFFGQHGGPGTVVRREEQPHRRWPVLDGATKRLQEPELDAGLVDDALVARRVQHVPRVADANRARLRLLAAAVAAADDVAAVGFCPCAAAHAPCGHPSAGHAAGVLPCLTARRAGAARHRSAVAAGPAFGSGIPPPRAAAPGPR